MQIEIPLLKRTTINQNLPTYWLEHMNSLVGMLGILEPGVLSGFSFEKPSGLHCCRSKRGERHKIPGKIHLFHYSLFQLTTAFCFLVLPGGRRRLLLPHHRRVLLKSLVQVGTGWVDSATPEGGSRSASLVLPMNYFKPVRINIMELKVSHRLPRREDQFYGVWTSIDSDHWPN